MQRIAIFSILALGIVGAFQNFDDDIPSIRALTEREMKLSEEAGYSYVDRLTQLEEELHAKGQYAKETSPFRRMAKFRKPSENAQELSRKATRMLEATRYLKNEMGLTNEESGIGLRQATSNFSVLPNTCLAPTTCATPSKYRTIDGSCNNLKIPNFGKSDTVYRRLSVPAYADGIEAPRITNSGDELPNARLVSATVIGGHGRPMPSSTLALMQWGQFINHDFQSTAQYSSSYESDIICCPEDGNMNNLHPACLPIAVAEDDPFYNFYKVTTNCISFVRSMAGPRLDCSLGYADQLNQNTHWLDASTVYGSNEDRMNKIRQSAGGRLRVSRDEAHDRDLLPTDPEGCTTSPEACFYAGDARATEQPQLTVMHTIWMREHNRIAYKLGALNPSWSDESIFQEARRIVIAEIQHITYNEFLPALLSKNTIANYGLVPLTDGFFTNYSSNLASSGPVSNEFSTAAFRMGHSLVQGMVELYNESGEMLSSYAMSDTFFDATKITQDQTYFDAVIRGLLTQPSQQVDKYVDDEIWNKLFKQPGNAFGFDVVALNIQRGRDHGLPGYNTYRELCGFTKLDSFGDLGSSSSTSPGFKLSLIANFASVYNTVDDIDLFVGGLAEIVPAGSKVGPTFSCLIGEHFATLKYMDRFFYELGGQPHSFTSAQLTEIRKTTLARIFCDNSDGTVLSVQPKAFVAVSSTNDKVSCSNTDIIPSLNMNFWEGENIF